MKSNPPRKLLGIALAATLALGACGGGGQEAVVGKLVVFGDSLSDVGTYRVGTIDAFGGGQYTVNNAQDFTNWTEQLALDLGVKRPCAARTGLLNSQLPPPADPAAHPPVAPAFHTQCFSYAQGGSRVTDPLGPGNAARKDGKEGLGALTDPVKTQIDRHLGFHPGDFAVSDLVLVWAGANDLFVRFEEMLASAVASNDLPQARQTALVAMRLAGTQLAAQVKDRLLAKDARRVVVLNLPDVGRTPLAHELSLKLPPTLGPAVAGLLAEMAGAFNEELEKELAGRPQVLLVDIFTRSRAQADEPAKYGIGNITEPACNLAIQLLPSALACSKDTRFAGTQAHFYADDVHPTPFGHGLIAGFVLEQMKARGWR